MALGFHPSKRAPARFPSNLVVAFSSWSLTVLSARGAHYSALRARCHAVPKRPICQAMYPPAMAETTWPPPPTRAGTWGYIVGSLAAKVWSRSLSCHPNVLPIICIPFTVPSTRGSRHSVAADYLSIRDLSSAEPLPLHGSERHRNSAMFLNWNLSQSRTPVIAISSALARLTTRPTRIRAPCGPADGQGSLSCLHWAWLLLNKRW